MNFVIYSIKNKRTGAIPKQGFVFVKGRVHDDEESRIGGKDVNKILLESEGYSPKFFEVYYSEFKTLKKLRKAYWKALRS